MHPRPPLRTACPFLLIALLACGDASQRQAEGPPPAPLVEAVEARFGALPIEESMPGVVRARNQVAVRPEIAGRVVAVPASIGDAVERGQLLVKLDDAEARDRLRQAEADVRLAEAGAAAARARVAELEARVARTRSLAEQALVSTQEMETLEAQLDALEANAAEAAARVEQRRAAAEERRAALAKTAVRSPVAGRLGDRTVEVGMQVDPSTVLFVVGNLDQLIIAVDLTETMLARVEQGLPVIVGDRALEGEPIRAELSRVSPFLATESFTTVGEIDVDNREGRLRPGMFVTVRILVGESRRATLIPVSALWNDPASGQQGVFVVEGGALETESEEPRDVSFRPVEVLAEGRGIAGVSGIDEGVRVVTLGQQLLAAELRAAMASGEAVSRAGGGSEAGMAAARVRPVSWERILELQNLQDEDLLEDFLDKQRKVAAALGAEIPESEDAVDRVMAEADAASPPTPSSNRGD